MWRRLAAALSALLLFTACGVCRAAPPSGVDATDLLVVMGDVTATSARVLVEAVDAASVLQHATMFTAMAPPPAVAAQTVPVAVTVHRKHARGPWHTAAAGDNQDGDNDVEMHVAAGHRPRVVTLSPLTPCSEYVATFHVDGSIRQDATVTFTTFGGCSDAAGAAEPLNVVVQSCDRLVDDGDTEPWMAPTRATRGGAGRHLTLHIGDQVYADSLVASLFSTPDTTTLSFEDVVERYRALYRYMWHHPARRTALRTGAHWMIPDDHDIVNNARPEDVLHWTPGVGAACGSLSPDDPAAHRRAVVYMAARVAYYEYQHQLVADVDSAQHLGCGDTRYTAHQPDTTGSASSSATAVTPAATRVWHFHTVNGVGFAMLDTRLDRVFNAGAAWVSDTQIAAVAEQLAVWDAAADVHTVVVASGTPILFSDVLAAKAAERFERESYPALPMHQAAAARLLDALRGSAKVQLLLAGDLHLYSATQVCHRPSSWCVPQTITSGVSNGSSTLNGPHLMLFETYVQRAAWPAIANGTYTASYAPHGFLGNNFVWLQLASPATVAECAAADVAPSCWYREDAVTPYTPKEGPLNMHPTHGGPVRWPWQYTRNRRLRWAGVTRPLTTLHDQLWHEVYHQPFLVTTVVLVLVQVALYAAWNVLCCACRRVVGRRPAAAKPKRD